MKEVKEYVGFIIDLGERTIFGVKKYINFVRGVGVLDLETLASSRPEWIATEKDGKFVQIAGPTPEMYAEYWSRFAKVTPITAKDATMIRAALISGDAISEKFLSVPWKEEPTKGEQEAAAEEAEEADADDDKKSKSSKKGAK